jgi:tetratricopeptide (TPR) repeat protein
MLRELLSSNEGSGIAAEVHEIVIDKLSLSAARELAADLVRKYYPAIVDSDEVGLLAEEIARQTDGHPYFIDGMARYLPVKSDQQTLGDSQRQGITLAEIIMRRVRQLPVSARELLEIVAVAGQPIKLKLAEKAARFDTQEQTAFIMLGKGHLARMRETATGDEVETYHDQIREAVVGSLSPRRLKACHQSLALELEADDFKDAERLMIHFQGSEDFVKAAHYAIAAADQASTALAFDHAAQLYQFALDFQAADNEDKQALQLKLADALTKAGRGAKAARIFLNCARNAQAEEALELQRRAAEQLLISGHIDDGIEVLRKVLEKIGMKLAKTPTRALISLMLQRFRIWLRGLEFRERNSSEIPAEELTRIDTCWSLSMGLSTVNTVYGADFQATNLLLALELGEPNRVARALAIEVAYNALPGQQGRRRAKKLQSVTRKLVERLNNPALTGLAKLMEGIAAWAEGDWRQAYLLSEEAEKILRDNMVGGAWEMDTAQLFWVSSLIPLGELKQASQRVPVLLKEAQDRGDLYAEINLRLRAAVYFHLVEDDVAKAEQEVNLSLEKWSYQGFHIQHYYAFIARSHIALCLAVYRGQLVKGEKFAFSQGAELARRNILFARPRAAGGGAGSRRCETIIKSRRARGATDGAGKSGLEHAMQPINSRRAAGLARRSRSCGENVD